MICDYDWSGLRMNPLQSFITYLKTTWIKRVLLTRCIWTEIFERNFSQWGSSDMAYSKNNSVEKFTFFYEHNFWKDTFSTWASVEDTLSDLQFFFSRGLVSYVQMQDLWEVIWFENALLELLLPLNSRKCCVPVVVTAVLPLSWSSSSLLLDSLVIIAVAFDDIVRVLIGNIYSCVLVVFATAQYRCRRYSPPRRWRQCCCFPDCCSCFISARVHVIAVVAANEITFASRLRFREKGYLTARGGRKAGSVIA